MGKIKNKILVEEINRQLGVDIKSKNRSRYNFYGRVILYNQLRKENKRITLDAMGQLVNRHHTSVVYAVKQYEILKKYADFVHFEKELLLNIKVITNKVFCNPITYSLN